MAKKIIRKSDKASKSSQRTTSMPPAPSERFTLLKNTAHAFSLFIHKNSRLGSSAIIIVIMLFGFLVRIEDLSAWKQYDQRAFFNGQPLHTTFDAFFYLSLAKDLVDGTYSKIDEKRSVPDCPLRPSPPPLISCLAAGIKKTTPFTLSWIGALLPAALGPLLAIPLFCIGRFYGGPLTGFIAALISLLYPFYVYRSNIGRFDTDCLNVTFTVTAAYLFLRFGTDDTRKRYFYFAGALIIYILFLWWWDQTPAAVTALTFLPLVVALLFFYRPSRHEAVLFYGFLAVCFCVFSLIKGPAVVVQIIKSIFIQYLYISKNVSGDFPNIGVTISEQVRPSLSTILSFTTLNILSFLFAVGGLFLLLFKRTKQSLFLIALIILSILTFTYANRFLIFFIPLLALGTGYGISFLWNLRKRVTALYIICPALFIGIVWPLYTSSDDVTQWPKEMGPVVKGMDIAKNRTPPDAVIWAWWDHGYALTYFARRATINDGSVHSGERTVYSAIPLATDDYRFAANFMHFYVKQGIKGIHTFCNAYGKGLAEGVSVIKKLLSSGPATARVMLGNMALHQMPGLITVDQWLSFFYPTEKLPVYLFLDNLLTKITYWWFWFGTWDMDRHEGIHPLYYPISGLDLQGNTLVGSNGFTADLDEGTVIFNGKPIHLDHFYNRSTSELEKKNYTTPSSHCLEMLVQARFGSFMDTRIAESVFNKLFIRHVFPSQYFRPIAISAPFYQLWEVKGDTIAHSNPDE